MLGRAGEPCAECGAPLAPDQRYCLACGRRRGPARIDWRALTPPAGGAAAPAPLLAAGPPGARRLVAAGAVLFLGLGLAGGALAGARPEETIAAARRLIVVDQPAAQVAAAPAPAAEPAPASSSASADPPDTTATDPAAEGGDDGGSPAVATDASAVAAEPPPVAPSTDDGSTTTTDDDTAATGDSTATSDAPAGPQVKHVWIVDLADHGFDEVLAPGAPAPYLAGELRPKGVLLPGFAAIAPGPLANGVALLSGQEPTADQRDGCPVYADTTCVLPASVGTLPGQLTEAGRTWKGYVEGTDTQPGQPSCRHPALGQPDPWTAPRPGDAYLTRRNPLVYFHAIVDTPDCSSSITGPSRIAPDAADSDSAPNLALVIPDACHDGRDAPCADGAPAGLAAADAWLKTVVAPILASKAYADGGAIVITFDQKAADPAGGTVGALVLSPLVRPGTTLDGAFTPADLLRTVEDLFALDPLGAAKRAKGFTQVFTNDSPGEHGLATSTRARGEDDAARSAGAPAH